MSDAELIAELEKLRAAQRLPSVQRTFWSGADKEQVEGLERKIDAELERRRGAGEGVDDEAG